MLDPSLPNPPGIEACDPSPNGPAANPGLVPSLKIQAAIATAELRAQTAALKLQQERDEASLELAEASIAEQSSIPMASTGAGPKLLLGAALGPAAAACAGVLAPAMLVGAAVVGLGVAFSGVSVTEGLACRAESERPLPALGVVALGLFSGAVGTTFGWAMTRTPEGALAVGLACCLVYAVTALAGWFRSTALQEAARNRRNAARARLRLEALEKLPAREERKVPASVRDLADQLRSLRLDGTDLPVSD